MPSCARREERRAEVVALTTSGVDLVAVRLGVPRAVISQTRAAGAPQQQTQTDPHGDAVDDRDALVLAVRKLQRIGKARGALRRKKGVHGGDLRMVVNGCRTENRRPDAVPQHGQVGEGQSQVASAQRPGTGAAQQEFARKRAEFSPAGVSCGCR